MYRLRMQVIKRYANFLHSTFLEPTFMQIWPCIQNPPHSIHGKVYLIKHKLTSLETMLTTVLKL